MDAPGTKTLRFLHASATALTVAASLGNLSRLLPPYAQLPALAFNLATGALLHYVQRKERELEEPSVSTP